MASAPCHRQASPARHGETGRRAGPRMQQGAGARGRPEAKREREKESPATSSRRRRRRRPRCSRRHHPARARAPAASLLARMPCVFAATPPPLVALNPRAYTRGWLDATRAAESMPPPWTAGPASSKKESARKRIWTPHSRWRTGASDSGSSLRPLCCVAAASAQTPPPPPFSFPLSVVCGTVDRRRQRLAPRNVFPLAATARAPPPSPA